MRLVLFDLDGTRTSAVDAECYERVMNPLAILFTSLLLLTPCTARAAQKFGPIAMPAIGLRASDSIDALDFVVDRDRSIDVAWLTTLRDDPNDYSSAKREVWYRHLDLARGSWSDPVLVTVDASAPLRMIAISGRVHVLMGPRLQHFISGDSGRTWRELPPLAPDRWVEAFDAIQVHDSILVAYLAFVPKRSSHTPDSLFVCATRWSANGVAVPAQMGIFEGVSPPDPKLLTTGNEVHLFYAVNRVNGGYDPNYVDARLYHSHRADRSTSWSPPNVIASLGRKDGKWRSEGSGYITDLDVIFLGGQFFALYNTHQLYVTRSQDGDTWTDASLLVGARTWFGPAAVSSVTAAVIGDRGELLWIDERFQHTDRTPWNPWGFPWFLTADWANNDILALPLSILERPFRAPIETKPTRLTRDLSFAATVRIRGGNRRLYAMWPGRVRVGKRPGDFGKPPTIFFQSLPPE